jgi:DNA-binding transcriptional LysR family regulator
MTDMAAAAASGVGIALLPCQFPPQYPALRRVSGVITERQMTLVYRKEARRNDAVKAVARFVIEVMQENADLLAGK